jgi:hypothetical protein
MVFNETDNRTLYVGTNHPVERFIFPVYSSIHSFRDAAPDSDPMSPFAC